MSSYWDQRAGNLRGQIDQDISTERGYGSRASQDYLSRAEGFDASKSLNDYARGQWGSISQALGSQLKGLRGNTGSGRFNSGFFDEDQGTLFSTATGQLTDAIARGSLDASAQNLRNQEGLADFGNNARGSAYGMTEDAYSTAENTSRDEAERRRKNRAGIGSAIGQVLGGAAGGIFLGPGGVGAGASVGGELGGYFGGH